MARCKIAATKNVTATDSIQIVLFLLPDEVLSAHDSDRDGVAEGLELDPAVLLEQLLAQEDVEARVSLVGNVDDVGVLSGLLLHFCYRS